jgi:hypothetical protein
MWRDLVKRYPDLDARRILEDLIETQGSKGKWFAAAKTAKYLNIALDCAAQPDAAPATLIRAARDFAIKEPAFAAQVALHAIGFSHSTCLPALAAWVVHSRCIDGGKGI